MNICFVCVVDEAGTYADLTYLAVLSVRLAMPSARVEVITDPESMQWLSAHKHPLTASGVVLRSVETPHGRSAAGSRYLKTSLRRLMEGDFLFLDSDTVVLGDLGSLARVAQPFAAVEDRNIKQPYAHVPTWRRHLYQEWGWPFAGSLYVNSGVMFVRDCPEAADLFRRWHERWTDGMRRGLRTDQPSLNSVLSELPGQVRVLSWRFNAMADASPYYLLGARVVHYYQSQREPGGLAEFFTELAALARTDRASAEARLRDMAAHPLRLLRLCRARSFVTQLPCRWAFRSLLHVRRGIAALRGRRGEDADG